MNIFLIFPLDVTQSLTRHAQKVSWGIIPYGTFWNNHPVNFFQHVMSAKHQGF